MSLLRPVRAGAYVEWSLTLCFESPKADGPAELETDLMFVLFDRTAAGIQVQRSRQSDAPTSVKFVQEKPGQTQANAILPIPSRIWPPSSNPRDDGMKPERS